MLPGWSTRGSQRCGSHARPAKGFIRKPRIISPAATSRWRFCCVFCPRRPARMTRPRAGATTSSAVRARLLPGPGLRREGDTGRLFALDWRAHSLQRSPHPAFPGRVLPRVQARRPDSFVAFALSLCAEQGPVAGCSAGLQAHPETLALGRRSITGPDWRISARTSSASPNARMATTNHGRPAWTISHAPSVGKPKMPTK